MGENSQPVVLECLYANVQSLLSKKKEIEQLTEVQEFDILLFTEVWIDEEHQDFELYIRGYQNPSIDRNCRCGACVYVREGLDYINVEPPYRMKESVWICVKTSNNVERLYGCLYKSPNSEIENNENLLRNISWAKSEYEEVVLVGDFNMPGIDWVNEDCNSEATRRFLDCLNDSGLEQFIEEPTRYRHGQTPSVLDLLITSNPDIVNDIKLEDPLGKCDHVKITFSVSNMNRKNISSKQKYKNMLFAHGC